MLPIVARSAILRTAAARTVARRQMSAQPKMHKSKDKWADMLSQRPPKDHLDEHVSRIDRDEFRRILVFQEKMTNEIVFLVSCSWSSPRPTMALQWVLLF
jgi:hypothetical protein